MPALVPFVLGAAVAFAISLAHLGRPLRAWRAVFGLSTSWLSREVVASGSFAVLATWTLAMPASPPLLAIGAIGLAGLAVIAIDAVYLAVPRVGPRFHGSEATGAFVLLAGIVADLPWLVGLAAAVKLILIIARWRGGWLHMPIPVAATRIGLLVLVAIVVHTGWPWPMALGLAFLSEALDRVAFYAALEPTTPASRMEHEARAALG
jgi:DMSO reductase anchor subunit